MPATKTPTQKASQKGADKAPRDRRSGIKKTTDLSEQVLEQLEVGSRSAIAAVRRFIDSTDDALPSLGDGRSRTQEVIDSALEMSERLIEVRYSFVRNVVHSAGEALGGSSAKK